MATDSSLLKRRTFWTKSLIAHPYDARLYLARAKCHEKLQFHDLAAADGYKALLLLDDVQDGSGEYHEQAIEALEIELPMPPSSLTPAFDDHDLPYKSIQTQPFTNILATSLAMAYGIISRNLLACGCVRSAQDFCVRGLALFPEDGNLASCKNKISNMNIEKITEADCGHAQATLPDEGFIRREVYPWNDHEPDRFSEATLACINEDLEKIAPKCHVKAVELPLLTQVKNLGPQAIVTQLGLFAREDIASGELVLSESSILTASNRLYDPLCDACASELPSLPFGGKHQSCSTCDDTLFCSSDCFNVAMSSYHPAVCDKNIDPIGREVDPKETSDALYLLLLARALALAETQCVHPLELKETRFLWGDFTSDIPSEVDSYQATLPFSFKYNILYPLHLLQNMNIDVFTTLVTYDAWIINTLYAKLRAVASGRVNKLTGRPEVCAVHPLWHLANHSCAPNVKWEWGAKIQFWARTEDEIVKYSADNKLDTGGIHAGQEILSHYCDIGLNVHDRREWAKGALGGLCLCDRCEWEVGNCNVTGAEQHAL